MSPGDVYVKFRNAIASVELPDELWHADVRIDDSDGYRVRVYHYRPEDLTEPDRKVVMVVPWPKALRATPDDVVALVHTMVEQAQRDGDQ